LGDPAEPLPIAAVKGKNLGPHLPRVGFLFLSGVRSAGHKRHGIRLPTLRKKDPAITS